MAVTIGYTDDVFGNVQETSGSDRRLNVSARSDYRIYYNSRDEQQTFSVAFKDDTSATGTYSVFWQNDHDEKTLVIADIEISAVQLSTFKFSEVTSANLTGGSTITPFCHNRATIGVAKATARGNDAITTLTEVGVFRTIKVSANSGEHYDLHDTIRLGPGQAFAIETDLTASSGIVEGTIVGYYE